MPDIGNAKDCLEQPPTNFSIFTLKNIVVSKMGILAQTSNYQKCIKKTNKIPDYARNQKNEYLFIRGINKTCEKFVKIFDLEGEIFDLEGEIFNSSQANKLIFYFNKFLKAQEIEYLNDISELYFKESDVRFIESLELKLDDYMDLFYDPDSYEFDQEKYENDYRGLKEFFESFSKFKDKINIEELSFSDFKRDLSYLDSDDDIVVILSDSDSDSD